ncbi:MAG TPA: type VI secretion system tube protein Hcp [Phycisphaerales bacterium]|nr:type VI secretion system tube protein Hcp [Phycisphaerales bacterium]
MSLDGYLWLGGAQGIRGEAKHYLYSDWLGVRGLTWGVRQDAAVNPTGSQTLPTADVDAFSFTHELDRASPGIFQACLQGRNIPEVRFVVLQPDTRGETYERLRITFRNCLITGVEVTAEGASVSETVAIVFGEIDIQARPRPIDAGQ